jgi:hypothetical protein
VPPRDDSTLVVVSFRDPVGESTIFCILFIIRHFSTFPGKTAHFPIFIHVACIFVFQIKYYLHMLEVEKNRQESKDKLRRRGSDDGKGKR